MGFMRQFQCHLKIGMWLCIQIKLNVHNCYNFNHTRLATAPYSSIHPCIILQQDSCVHIAIWYYSTPVFLNLHPNDIWGQIISYVGWISYALQDNANIETYNYNIHHPHHHGHLLRTVSGILHLVLNVYHNLYNLLEVFIISNNNVTVKIFKLKNKMTSQPEMT